MTKRQEHFRRRLAGAVPRITAVAIAAASMGFVCIALSFLVRRVTVRDSGGPEALVITARHQPQALIAMAGLEPERPEDTVTLRPQDDGSLLLLVQRGFSVKIAVDKTEVEALVSSGTVADLLAGADIFVGEDDEVTPALSSPVYEGMDTVRVARVFYREWKQREAIPFEVQFLDESETTAGPYLRDIVEQTGEDGLAEVTYRKKYVDGVYTETQAVSTRILTEMQPEIHHKYYTNVVSPLPPPEGITVENNVPSSYTAVYSMKSTGYYSPGGRGASGLGLYYGTFACDPNVIPYGTKVYIASEDGSFVYGWAIATDTGAFALSNPMQVDLFYETYAESAAHGVRQVNVYIP